ncbi:hypothetical protein WOB85_22495, partial [Vibrio parahaemolyticus]
DKQQDKVNQTNGLRLQRYRLLLFKDKSGFPRKAAMNHFYYALNLVIKAICGNFAIALLTP